MDPARRGALVQTKLNALARDGLGVDVDAAQPVGFPGGAALLVPGEGGQRGVVYVAADAALPLGSAVVWAGGQSVAALDVIIDDAEAAAIAARQSAGLAVSVTVWQATGSSLHEPAQQVAVPGLKTTQLDPLADPKPAQQVAVPGLKTTQLDPLADPKPAQQVAVPGLKTTQLDPLADVITAAGATVVVEQGVVVGEVDGLEVARVVANEEGTLVLRVGVGVYDQEAYAVMHPGDVAGAGLAAVVARVREYRRPGAPGHMINRLARERWLRARVCAQPELVGARSLSPVSGVVPRLGLHQAMPAAAVGLSADGRAMLVVASSGIDPQVIAVAADHLAADPTLERVVIALPPRDVHPALLRAAAWLRVPGEVIGVPAPWGANPESQPQR